MSSKKTEKKTEVYGGGSFAELKQSIQESVSPDLWRKTGFALRGFVKILEGHSDFEKLSLLYQMVAAECRYDESLKRFFTRNYIGGLRDRIAVCAAYAELMMLLVAGLTNYTISYVVGKTRPKSKSYHAWNIIEMDGQAYHLDITWDLQKKQFQYFLKSDAEMRGRLWDQDRFPRCPREFDESIYRNDATLDGMRRYFRKLESAFKTTGDFTVDE